MNTSPFAEENFKQAVAEHEFRYFKRLVSKHLKEVSQSVDRLSTLSDHFSFWVDPSVGDNRLQFDLGNRSMFKKDLSGKLATEKGPTLLYTLAPTGGHVVVVLYPAKSTLGGVQEDHLFLRMGRFSGYQLFKKLRSDLSLLVSYTYVTSLETTPSYSDRARIWLLRKTMPQSIDGKIVEPVNLQGALGMTLSMIARATIVALLYPYTSLIAATVFIALGYEGLAQLLKR